MHWLMGETLNRQKITPIVNFFFNYDFKPLTRNIIINIIYHLDDHFRRNSNKGIVKNTNDIAFS